MVRLFYFFRLFNLSNLILIHPSKALTAYCTKYMHVVVNWCLITIINKTRHNKH